MGSDLWSVLTQHLKLNTLQGKERKRERVMSVDVSPLQDPLTQWSSGGPWPLVLPTSERWAKLASQAPSPAPAPDLDPDPDPDHHTDEEQYVGEGEFGQPDAHPAPPDYRDAETITGRSENTEPPFEFEPRRIRWVGKVLVQQFLIT